MGTSYRQIRDEVLDALPVVRNRRAGPEGTASLLRRLKEAQAAVLERRIREGDISPLVPYAIENFDTNSGDEFVWPLSRALVAEGAVRDLRRLWMGIIANRRRVSGKPRADGDPTLSARELEARKGTIRAMREYVSALREVGEGEEADRVEEEIGRFRAGKGRRKARAKPDRRPMDEEVFWDLIEESAGEERGTAAHVERLLERLERFPLRSIRAFQKRLYSKLDAAYHRDLWAVAWIVRGGCGDDEFNDFRAWLVLQGRERFSSALTHPESVAGFLGDSDPQCEALLYAAEQAYENRQDAPMPEVDRPRVVLEGSPWDEDDLPGRFPELWPRFCGPS